MQSGRGEGLGSAFGSSFSGGAIFGGRGATEFLTKVTIIGGIIFGVLAVAISFYVTHGPKAKAPSSVIKERATQQAPMAAPGEEEKVAPTAHPTPTEQPKIPQQNLPSGGQ